MAATECGDLVEMRWLLRQLQIAGLLTEQVKSVICVCGQFQPRGRIRIRRPNGASRDLRHGDLHWRQGKTWS